MEEGRITFYEAVEEAEAIEERVWPDVDVIEFPADDPRSLPTEIISILSKGFVAPLSQTTFHYCSRAWMRRLTSKVRRWSVSGLTWNRSASWFAPLCRSPIRTLC